MSENLQDLPKKPPLCGSCRFVYSVCVFFVCILHVCMRLNLSLTSICMVKKEPSFSRFNLSAGVGADELSCMARGRSATVHPIEGELYWSDTQEWLVISAFFYGYLVGQPACGLLISIFGAKNLLIFSLISQGVCTLTLPPLARLHVYAIFAIRVLQGFVGGAVVPATYQLYTIWAHPSERSFLINFGYAGVPVGSIVVFPFSSFLCQVDSYRGWPLIFYITGSTSVIFGIILYWLIFDSINDHPRISAAEKHYLHQTEKVPEERLKVPVVKILTSVPIVTFCVVHFCTSWGYQIVSLATPHIMKDVLYLSIEWNGLVSAVPFAGTLITRILLCLTYRPLLLYSGLTLTTFRKIYHLAGCILCTGIIFSFTYLSCQQSTLFVVLMGFLGATQDLCYMGSYYPSFLELAPSYAGLLSGFTNVLATLTGVVTPNVISAFVKEHTKKEWNNVFYISAGIFSLSAIVYTIFGSSEPIPWGQYIKKDVNNEETKKT